VAVDEIRRFSGAARGRSRASAWRDLVFTVATAADPDASLAEQTRRSLETLDRNLADCGTDKSRILSATVYITDIAAKYDMDDVWCEWIGPPENWPQRACVQAALAPDTLVEITIVAARG
jgi:enamine deaminase RidA (YjgF/YER057c/UK114 family)